MTHPEPEESRERLAERLTHQWQAFRAERREPLPIQAGQSNFSRAQVPWGMDLAAAWAWRFLVIVFAGYLIVRTLAYFGAITLPIVVALLITALASPAVGWLSSVGVPRTLSAIVVVLLGIASITVLLTFAGQQVANGANDLATQVAKGLGEVKDWLKTGPLDATDSQINGWLEEAQQKLQEKGRDPELVSQITEVGTALGHVLAGFFIVLFSTYFFLADGERIWAWCVRIAPRAARERVDTSGRVAWVSLTQFVRATVIVALVDAIGIMVVAAILRVPFVLAIGVLVFLGAFVPMIGATIAGTVAVLVALVDRGPIVALLMLGGVILVQQIEGHVLQPFLMGRWVSLHPLGVIAAIGCGVIVAGIAGALIAVPLAAAGNAVVQHLAAHTDIGEDPEEALDEEIPPDGGGHPDTQGRTEAEEDEGDD